MAQQNEELKKEQNRRGFLTAAGAAGLTYVGAGVLTGCQSVFAAKKGKEISAAPMSPNEDLMQEHALLSRVDLIYDEAVRRLQGKVNLDPTILKKAAETLRLFVEQYHEKLEEDYVFPRFIKAGKKVELVNTLLEQHEAGRIVTANIIALCNRSAFNDPAERGKLIALLRSFTRMYRPHAAREGSELFPAFRDLLPAEEFNALGELFEKKEHEQLGSEGFEGQVEKIAELEKQLGLYTLTQYTPK